MDYSHLNKYPNLKQFCEEEQISLAAGIYSFQELRLQEIITEITGRDFSKRRCILDSCLGFAYKHALMNNDRRGRLKSKDQNYWSIFGELRVGYWLESLGFSISEFEPPAKAGHKGDYLVSLNGSNSIFTEVKVFSGDREYCSRSDLLSKIACLTQEKQLKVNDITIMEYGYVDIKTRENILDRIRNFLETTSIPAVFTDHEYHIKIAFDIKQGMPFNIGWGGSVETAEKLSDLLRGVQVSRDTIPSLVFIYDFDSWASDDIENVLYGNRVIDSASDNNYRKGDGVWDMRYQSPLSAVGMLKFSLDNIFPSEVTIYLSPNPEYAIPLTAISACGSKIMTLASNKYDLVSIKIG